MEIEDFIKAIHKNTVPYLQARRTEIQEQQAEETLVGCSAMSWHLFRDGPSGEERNKKLFMLGVFCRMKHGRQLGKRRWRP